MRSVIVLLAGFGLLACGVAVLAADGPGGSVLGVSLVVGGLLLKLSGLLMGDPSNPARPAGRRGSARTLAGRTVEPPRAGIPSGRATLHRRTPGHASGAVMRPLRTAARRRPQPSQLDPARRRAS